MSHINVNVNISLPPEIVAQLQAVDTSTVDRENNCLDATMCAVIEGLQDLPYTIRLKPGRKRAASEAVDAEDDEETGEGAESSQPAKRAKIAPHSVHRVPIPDNDDDVNDQQEQEQPNPDLSEKHPKAPTWSRYLPWCSDPEPEPSRDFTIFVRNYTGKTLSLYFPKGAQTTMTELRARIEEKDGIPPDAQRIVFAGKQLGDVRVVRSEVDDDEWIEELTLGSYGIANMSTVHLVLRLCGS